MEKTPTTISKLSRTRTIREIKADYLRCGNSFNHQLATFKTLFIVIHQNRSELPEQSGVADPNQKGYRLFVRQRRMRLKRAVIAALAMCSASFFAEVSPAHADTDVSVSDLEATTRSLGFLDSLHLDGTIVVGIVYLPGNAESKHVAERAAATLARMSGPKSATIETAVIGADDFAQFSGLLDAVFLLPGVPGANGVGETIRRLHVVSISNDPSCIDAKCCVLMIRTGGSVEIVLDTTLAEAVGARFSSVFAMMVKRK